MGAAAARNARPWPPLQATSTVTQQQQQQLEMHNHHDHHDNTPTAQDASMLFLFIPFLLH